MNPFLTDYDEPLKISDEMRDAILDECRSDSSKIIEYLEEQKIENDKQYRVTRNLAIFANIIGLLTLLITILSVIPTLESLLQRLQ